MSDDNVLDLFEGLSKEQAQQLRERIMPTLQELRKNITGVTMSQLDPIISEAIQRQPQEPQDPQDPTEELQTNAAQLQKLYKNKTQNAAKIKVMEAQNEELWKQHKAFTDAQREQGREARAPQIRALKTELQALTNEYQPLSKFPTKNRQRLHELDAQIETKSKQIEQLEAE